MGDSKTFLDSSDLNECFFSGKKSRYEKNVSFETCDTLALVVEVVGHDVDTITNS